MNQQTFYVEKDRNPPTNLQSNEPQNYQKREQYVGKTQSLSKEDYNQQNGYQNKHRGYNSQQQNFESSSQNAKPPTSINTSNNCKSVQGDSCSSSQNQGNFNSKNFQQNNYVQGQLGGRKNSYNDGNRTSNSSNNNYYGNRQQNNIRDNDTHAPQSNNVYTNNNHNQRNQNNVNRQTNNQYIPNYHYNGSSTQGKSSEQNESHKQSNKQQYSQRKSEPDYQPEKYITNKYQNNNQQQRQDQGNNQHLNNQRNGFVGKIYFTEKKEDLSQNKNQNLDEISVHQSKESIQNKNEEKSQQSTAQSKNEVCFDMRELEESQKEDLVLENGVNQKGVNKNSQDLQNEQQIQNEQQGSSSFQEQFQEKIVIQQTEDTKKDNFQKIEIYSNISEDKQELNLIKHELENSQFAIEEPTQDSSQTEDILKESEQEQQEESTLQRGETNQEDDICPEIVKFSDDWIIWMCFSQEKSSNRHQDQNTFLQNNEQVLSFNNLKALSLILNNCRIGKISNFFTFRQSHQFQYGQDESKMRTIDAISFFKKGIKPIWEDEHNSSGQDLQTMFLGITAEEIDKIYVEFLANIFSEEFPYNEQMTGFRWVEKGGIKKSGVRLEIWFDKLDENTTNDIKNYFTDLIRNRWQPYFQWKSHRK